MDNDSNLPFLLFLNLDWFSFSGKVCIKRNGNSRHPTFSGILKSKCREIMVSLSMYAKIFKNEVTSAYHCYYPSTLLLFKTCYNKQLWVLLKAGPQLASVSSRGCSVHPWSSLPPGSQGTPKHPWLETGHSPIGLVHGLATCTTAHDPCLPACRPPISHFRYGAILLQLQSNLP